MTDLYTRLEITDDTDANLIVVPSRSENRGFNLSLRRFNQSELVYNVRNTGLIKDKIVFGKQVRVFVDQVDTSGLVGMWHFDGNSKDFAGSAHDGVDGSAITYVSNIGFDKAAYFDRSTNSVITVTDHADLRKQNTFTVLCWVYLTSLATDGGLSSRVLAKSDDANNGYMLYVNAAGVVHANVRASGTTTAKASAVSLSANTLYLIGFTYDNGTITVYVNGTGYTAAGTVGTLPSAPDLIFGRLTSTSGRLNGYLDEARFYTRVLTSAEITTIYNSDIQFKQLITGAQIEYDQSSTVAESLAVSCRDYFTDLCLSEDINKRYADQEIATTVTDLIGTLNTKRSAGLTTNGVQTLDISVPFNFVSENVLHAFTRITKSGFAELFMSPVKDITLRLIDDPVDSGITITDANIRNPEGVKIKRGISDSYGKVRVVGGLSTETYDSGYRVMAEQIVSGAPATIADRVYDIADERFTTWLGAKIHAMTIANEIGAELYVFNEAIQVHDLTDLPEPGELVTINSTKLGISNVSFIVEEIGFEQVAGQDTVKFVSLKLGKTEQGEVELLRVLKEIFESERRKAVDADTATDEKFFSIPITLDNGVTITITARNPVSTPYVWGDGSGTVTGSEFAWSFASWGDG